MSELFKSTIESIPEVSYDLFSRILPGGIIVSAFIARFQVGAVVPYELNETIGMVIFLFVSYAVGLIISAYGHTFHWVLWPAVYLLLELNKRDKTYSDAKNYLYDNNSKKLLVEYEDLSGCSFFASTKLLDNIRSFITDAAPEKEKLLVKLFTEVALLYNLAIATFIAGILVIPYWCMLEISGDYFSALFLFIRVISLIPVILFFAGIICFVRNLKECCIAKACCIAIAIVVLIADILVILYLGSLENFGDYLLTLFCFTLIILFAGIIRSFRTWERHLSLYKNLP